jgi:signal transduction histidine kinase
MWKFARPLRLLIVLFAVFIIVFMHWRSHMVARFFREALYRTWAQGIEWHEMTLRQISEHTLDKPFMKYDEEVNRFVKPEMDVDGFLRWLKKDTIHDSLIGAGIVWRCDTDTLVVVSQSLQVNSSIVRNLHKYMDLVYKPQYYPDIPDSVKPSMDSLKREINKSIGFSPYIFNYYTDYKNYPTRKKQAEARKVVFVVIWNHEYYRRALLPSITEQITVDPKQFGFRAIKPEGDYRPEGYFNGILLIGAGADTLYSYGRVQLERDSLFLHYKSTLFEYIIEKPLERSPQWRLYVQDHWEVDPKIEGMIIFGEPNLQTPADLIKLSLALPWLITDKPPMVLLTLALGTLFLVIMVQIIARNRQRDFIAHVSHELRTPVAKVKLFAETLRQDRAVSEAKENEYLDTILRESDHLSVLIDNTLNLARLDAGKLKIIKQPIDLSDWMTKLIEKHHPGLAASGFEVQFGIEPNLPPLKADPQALELALNNLIDNAVKYSVERKEIQISVLKKSKDRVQISVSDRGIGIPTGKRRAIFKRFYRIKPKDREPIAGAGVGLSLVKEIVKRHRGRVWCQARDGGGSTFIMELPIGK